MRLKLLKPNYVLYISTNNPFEEGKRILGCGKTFYSQKGIKKVFEHIELMSDKIRENEIENPLTLQFTLKDKKNNISRSFSTRIQLPESEKELRDKFIQVKHLLVNKFEDPLLTRYRVIIDNIIVPKSDKKAFSFNSKKSIEEVFEEIKDKTKQMIIEKTEDDIIFDYEKKTNNTHRVLVYKGGTAQNHRSFLQSKCFSINFPHHSSKEIIDYLRDEQHGER